MIEFLLNYFIGGFDVVLTFGLWSCKLISLLGLTFGICGIKKLGNKITTGTIIIYIFLICIYGGIK